MGVTVRKRAEESFSSSWSLAASGVANLTWLRRAARSLNKSTISWVPSRALSDRMGAALQKLIKRALHVAKLNALDIQRLVNLFSSHCRGEHLATDWPSPEVIRPRRGLEAE